MTTRTGKQTVKVKKTKLAACLTCPLCDMFFRDATTITECVHTFCRECIWKKLGDENLKHCPVCKVDLGCTPLCKLRTDHNLRSLREKIFPLQNRLDEPPPVPSSSGDKTVSSSRDKHVSQLGDEIVDKAVSHLGDKIASSLQVSDKTVSQFGDNSTELSSRSSISARRHEIAAKKNAAAAPLLNEIHTRSSKNRTRSAARKKINPKHIHSSTIQPDQSAGDHNGKEQLQTQNVMTEEVEYNQQKSSEADLRHQKLSEEICEKNAELWKGKALMLEPLNCLTEAARKVDTTETTIMQENAGTAILPVDSGDNNNNTNTQAAGDRNEENPVQAEVHVMKTKKLRSSPQRKVKFSQDLNFPAPPEPVTASSTQRVPPVWFSLVASQDKEENARLPQIPSRYLRMKDGSVPVSHIEKYIKMKLNLASEAEVEISLHGRPVLSSLLLQNVIDMWLETVPNSERIKASVGSSAKDFVMLLSYARKINYS